MKSARHWLLNGSRVALRRCAYGHAVDGNEDRLSKKKTASCREGTISCTFFKELVASFHNRRFLRLIMMNASN